MRRIALILFVLACAAEAGLCLVVRRNHLWAERRMAAAVLEAKRDKMSVPVVIDGKAVGAAVYDPRTGNVEPVFNEDVAP